MDNQHTIIELEAQISALKKQLKNVAEESKKKEEKLTSQINTLKAENNNLMELLKLSKKKMFGSSAEKIAESYGQISFFNSLIQKTEAFCIPIQHFYLIAVLIMENKKCVIC